MSSDKGTRGINAMLIIEVMGKPPEHLTETLKNITKKIGEEKGIKLIDQKVNEPELMKDRKDFYTSFAEVEIESEEMFNVAALVFKYMPAHVEILSPEMVSLNNNEWNDILNEVTRRLHGYDEIARIVQTEKVVLEKKLREALGDQANENKKKDK